MVQWTTWSNSSCLTSLITDTLPSFSLGGSDARFWIQRAKFLSDASFWIQGAILLIYDSSVQARPVWARGARARPVWGTTGDFGTSMVRRENVACGGTTSVSNTLSLSDRTSSGFKTNGLPLLVILDESASLKARSLVYIFKSIKSGVPGSILGLLFFDLIQ